MNRPRIGWEIEVVREGEDVTPPTITPFYIEQASGQICKDDVNGFSLISYICFKVESRSKPENLGVIQTFIIYSFLTCCL
jgi:hypothetical protein